MKKDQKVQSLRNREERQKNKDSELAKRILANPRNPWL